MVRARDKGLVKGPPRAKAKDRVKAKARVKARPKVKTSPYRPDHKVHRDQGADNQAKAQAKDKAKVTIYQSRERKRPVKQAIRT